MRANPADLRGNLLCRFCDFQAADYHADSANRLVMTNYYDSQNLGGKIRHCEQILRICVAIYFADSAVFQAVDYHADSANRLVMTNYYDSQNLG